MDRRSAGAPGRIFPRDVDQVEQFFLESRFWQTVFPGPLLRQAERMRSFSLEVLRAVLAELDLPVELWDEATGRCLSMQGTYHLTFNHFRSHVRARGLNVHKDSGWVTILRSLEPGLEVLREGDWLPVSPRPGEFIVNFGCAMEILTRHSATPVAAVAHRVQEQLPGQADRFSYALFVDSSLDPRTCPGLFRYLPGHGLVLEADFEMFLNEILHNTYQENTQGLY
ncbi:isopenicillin N synthase family oxygenase [Pseudomonas aeruginosa]|uniref:isopenicillin N synthase family oxygenase n=1 Tax=Pseudomonas aeruginosa TaxID=287 RepID=UPI001ABC4386|nr:isopenicillin N synthase family oxygenase [Pseudomonas aeruginosa]